MTNPSRIKVVRVITAPEVVKFHLKNFLKYASNEYDIVVIGTQVSQYQHAYPHIRFIDHEIVRKISPFKDLVSLVGLIRILKKEKPDVLHSIMPKSGLLAALAGFYLQIPVRLHTFTGQVWATKKNLIRHFLKSIDGLIIQLNTLCLTDSRSQSNFLYENGLKINGQPLPVVGQGSLDGVDLETFDQQKLQVKALALRHKYQIPESGFVFIFLGRKNQDKGVHLLIQAFKNMSLKYADCYLFYVGPSESDDITLNIISNIKNLISVGFTDEPEFFIAASNVFCLPSFREGFGNTVIECAAVGVPTIGSKIPGLIDSIQDNVTGLLFPVGSTEQLQIQMEKLYLDRQILNSLSKNCTHLVREHYSANEVHQYLFELYKKTIKEQQSDQ